MFLSDLLPVAEHACLSAPCSNGGSCSETSQGYECQCAPGWSGPSCTISTTPPLQLQVLRTHILGSNRVLLPRCRRLRPQPLQPWRHLPGPGQRLQVPLSFPVDGEDLPDRSDARRLSAALSRTRRRLKSSLPLLDANECDSKPCVNANSCRNLIGGYFCECVPGWTGQNCDIGQSGALPLLLRPASSINAVWGLI